MKKPNKFSGALDIRPIIFCNGRDRKICICIPVVDATCPNCSQPINGGNNELILKNQPDIDLGTFEGAYKCSVCKTIFNETTCYLHYDFQNATLIYLICCILSDENPIKTISKGFIPGEVLENGIWFAKGAQIGKNVVFIPPVVINKKSVISDGCEIGPGVYIEDGIIGGKAKLRYCDVRKSTLNRDSVLATFHNSVIL